METRRTPIAVLISGSGTTLQNLIDRAADGSLRVSIDLVIASRPGIQGIDRAKAAGIDVVVLDGLRASTPEAYSKSIFDRLRVSGVELVCLAGWLHLLDLPEDFSGRVLNIHPALLPSFGGKGMYGRHVHQAVLDAGCRVSGCTVHFVTNDYDDGPIVVQRVCPVLDTDTATSLAARVFQEECLAYPEAIELVVSGRYRIAGKRVLRL